MATKIQVACKISAIPQSRTVNGRIEFFLGEEGRILTVRVKPKVFNKLTKHGFEDWVATVTGELGPITETGFELVNAGIQVFEKKNKETPKEEGGASVDAGSSNRTEDGPVAETGSEDLNSQAKQAGDGEAQQVSPDPKQKSKRKKRLTDGIRFG